MMTIAREIHSDVDERCSIFSFLCDPMAMMRSFRFRYRVAQWLVDNSRRSFNPDPIAASVKLPLAIAKTSDV